MAQAATSRSPGPVHLGPRTYLRIVWADLFWLITFGVLTAGIFYTPIFHFQKRGVPYWSSRTRTSPPDVHLPLELSHKHEEPPLPSWLCGCLVVVVPIIVIASFQVKVKSLWDWHCGMTGTLKALVSTTFVCTTLKQVGLLPSTARSSFMWVIVINNLQSFPSGHTSSAFASGTFLAFYLNAKLKTFARSSSAFWAFIATITPLLLASLLGGSMYVSHQHHASDIIFGMALGIWLGTLAYRSSYTAIFDFRYNHIPLPPSVAQTRLPYSLKNQPSTSGSGQYGGMEMEATFTPKRQRESKGYFKVVESSEGQHQGK